MGAWQKVGATISSCSSRGHPVGVIRWLLGLVAALLVAAVPSSGRAEDVPVVKGELGPCTAAFTVTDSANKPLYDAKIHVTIAYGFMSKRKTDLEVGTNAEGKARFEGLPDKVKKLPLEFKVRYGGLETKSVTNDPAVNCHASFTVALSSR